MDLHPWETQARLVWEKAAMPLAHNWMVWFVIVSKPTLRCWSWLPLPPRAALSARPLWFYFKALMSGLARSLALLMHCRK